MKIKYYLLSICCVILLVGCEKLSKNRNDNLNVSGTSISDTEDSEQIENLSWRVVDLDGKKRKLDLFGLNFLEESGIRMEFFNYATEYFQMADDNFYYMNSIETIYKNKGQLVGKFGGNKGRTTGCVKYGDSFYVSSQFEDVMEYSKEKIWRETLSKINLQTHNTTAIYEFPSDKYTGDVYFFNRHIYITNYTDNCIEELALNGQRKRVISFDRKKLNIISEPIQYIIKNKVFLNGIKKDNEIIFYNFDIEMQKKKEMFRYSYTPTEHGKWKFDSAELEVKHGNIYICEIYHDGEISYRKKLYMIPAKTKKMQKVSDSYIEKYAVSEKYVFYTDNNHKIHKYSISTQKDSVISDIKAMDIACAKEGLYVQKYNEDLADSESNLTYDSSCGLYFMDFDGKNVVEIQEEKIEIE